jgi:hypothetical protein
VCRIFGKGKGKAIPVESLTAPEFSMWLTLLEFLDNRHMKVEPAVFTPQELPLVFISLTGCFDPRATVRAEGLNQ